MGYEIDFLAVGEDSRSGDAITLRFGNLNSSPSEQTVIVVDGGLAETGKKVVDHLKKYYKTEYVDIVVSTHPDGDHAAGLAVVLSELGVGQLWMHKPWEHTDDIARMFKDGRVTDASVEERIRKALDDVRELERIAKRRGILINEPFVGVADATEQLVVVGPTKAFYESLLPDFRCTPEGKVAGILEKVAAGVWAVVEKVKETFEIETLTDEGEGTSAENESSVVLLLRQGADRLLLTGDVGRYGLSFAADVLERSGFTPEQLRFVQVPHHGSRRNVGPTVLNRLLGPKRSSDEKVRTAFVSAAKDGAPKHPAKKVTNAFRRRGSPVYATQGRGLWHHSSDAPARPDYSAVEPLEFYYEVDE